MVTLVKTETKKLGKLKNKHNMLNINDSDKEDLIQILKSQSSNPSSSSDNDILSSVKFIKLV